MGDQEYPATGWEGRRIAILVADGADRATARSCHDGFARLKAVPQFMGCQNGQVRARDGAALDIDELLRPGAALHWDCLVLPDGEAASAALLADATVLAFIRQMQRDHKPILAFGAASTLLFCADALQPRPGLHVVDAGALESRPADVARATVERFCEECHPAPSNRGQRDGAA
ncbi:MAG: DJ-1/PfpI family protein [Burkholderiaceae bacterium]